ncbi:hypothetical protein PV11_03421 [Exophiala sideris]|uniref:Uncharacterized protein n=1 Tax=Exophiala sideris TaxID=1016849 RepID=A0A0D1WGL4_9EURO|nr:hypothetical protein PV11_03421 [Exophiala sideris]
MSQGRTTAPQASVPQNHATPAAHHAAGESGPVGMPVDHAAPDEHAMNHEPIAGPSGHTHEEHEDNQPVAGPSGHTHEEDDDNEPVAGPSGHTHEEDDDNPFAGHEDPEAVTAPLESPPLPAKAKPDYDPVSEQTRLHTRYKIPQTNHGMARRRIAHGDDVDKGFNGRVNPNPGGNNDPQETVLMNLQEARYHAVNEITGRQAFNNAYHEGQHQGINTQIALRQAQGLDPKQKTRSSTEQRCRSKHHPAFGRVADSTRLVERADNEGATRYNPYGGNHEQDYEPLTVGQDVQHLGQGQHDYGEGEEEGFDEDEPGEEEHYPDEMGSQDDDNYYD